MGRSWYLVPVTIAAAALWVAACAGNTDRYETVPASSDATADLSADVGDAGTIAAFGTSACRTCVGNSCSAEVTACGPDPTCADYLACLDACPVASTGAADPTCQGRCLNATSGSTSAALANLTSCMTSGAGSSCTACGEDEGGLLSGILNQKCQPDVDAANNCSQCIHERCCNLRSDCLNNPACLRVLNCFVDCVQGVPDDAGATPQPPDGGMYSCDLWCGIDKDPSGAGKWILYWACANDLCSGASACGPGDSCTSCNYQYCLDQELAIQETLDGYLWTDCIGQCATGDTACTTNCANTYPSVQGAATAWYACLSQHCPACGK